MLTRRPFTQTATRLAIASIVGSLMFAPIPSHAEVEALPALPHSVTGQSGGNSYTNDCGYVSDVASYAFRLTEATSDLSATVSSSAIGADMTLTIKGPDGRICLDDTNTGLMPSHEGSWPAGDYQVWVGDWGDSQPFTLTFD